MDRKTSAECATNYALAKKLIASGKSVDAAIKEVGLTKGSYYFNRAKDLKKPYAKWKNRPAAKLVVAKRASPRKLLNVQDLPMVAIDTEKLFMVYGTPSMLANFAKGLQ